MTAFSPGVSPGACSLPSHVERAGLVQQQPPIQVHSTPLGLGPEPEAAIRPTARREWLVVRPFYWASRRHILRAGDTHRLDVIAAAPDTA